jgi:hypothetical protein
VLSKEAEDWGRGAQPALEAAMGAALQPLFAAQADLDLSSEAAMNQQDPGKLQRFRGLLRGPGAGGGAHLAGLTVSVSA